MEAEKRVWRKIIGYQIGDKVRITLNAHIYGRRILGKTGQIVSIGEDSKTGWRVYYIRIDDEEIDVTLQLLEGDFELEV